MQAIEMIVFFIASISIAGLIIMFIGNIRPTEIYGTIERMIFPNPIDANKMATTKKAEFAGKIGACWEQCGFGERDLNCGTFYIKDDGLAETEKTLDISYLENAFKKYDYCTDCNVIIVGSSVELPAIVSMKCTRAGLVIEQ